MPRTDIPIASGYYVDESPAVSRRDLVNFYPHIPEGQTITKASLFGVSGIELLDAAGVNDFCRGLHSVADRPFGVMGGKVWELNSDLTLTDTTYPVEGSSKVFMADNGVELCIVAPDFDDPQNAYILNADADTYTKITDTNFDGPASCVDYSDGYFIFTKKDSNKWFISDLRQGTVYNALKFGSAESDPDNIVVIKSLRGIVFIFGSQTFEQYQNVGGAGLPYQKIVSGTYNKGCVAPKSIVEVNNSLVWIGAGVNEQPAIWVTNGGPPEKLSTASIETIIFSGGIEPVRESWVIQWAERGHSFLAFTVPDVCTVVYDFATGLWHRRESTDQFGVIKPWRVTAMIDAFSKNIVGDEYTGNIGSHTKDVGYEYDTEIKRYFTSPPIDNGGKPFSVNQVQLVCQTGHVPISGQGSDPVMRLSISRDGGMTYSPEISRKMGKIGQYEFPITWPLLGRYSRSFMARWDCSEPITQVIVKGEMEIAS